MDEMNPEATQEIPLKFLNLIGYVEAEVSDDLLEIFSRAEGAFRSKKFKQSDAKLRWFLHRWVRILRLDPGEWRRTILLRGLFLEGLSWSQLAYLLRLSEARVRALSFDALLEEVSPEDLLDRPTRDCARNDLYLLDVITRQAWVDRMGIYPPEIFESHLGECTRCRRVFDRTESYRNLLLRTRIARLPEPLDRSEVPQTEIETRRLPRFTLPMQVLGTLGIVVLIFAGVISTPYLGQYLRTVKKRSPILETREEVTRPPPQTITPPTTQPTTQPPVDTALLKELLDERGSEAAKSDDAIQLPTRFLRFMEQKKPVATAPIPSPPLAVKTPEVSAAAVGTSKIFFRWGARAQDPDRVTQKVLAWLKDLGAINAGELEFGAIYRGGRYFHFMIPKTAYTSLLGNIKTLPLTDFTDSAADSERVIQGDQSRIVFWIGPTDR
jgi:hypothetical protein